MPSEPVISVRGEAVLEVDPEIAVIRVMVTARDKDRRRALDLLTDRNHRLTALISGYGDAVEEVRSDPVHVAPELRDARGREKVAGYAAAAGLTLTVADLSVLGELVPRLADEDMVTVAGPSWRLRPASPAYRRARLAAARDATRRAREYAEAFGGQLAGLIQAADTGMLTEAEPRVMLSAARHAANVAMMDDQGEEFDFFPAKQTVRASVEARFTMTEPRLPD
jgi:uncharacterized protein